MRPFLLAGTFGQGERETWLQALQNALPAWRVVLEPSIQESASIEVAVVAEACLIAVSLA
ncbi:MAG TPA: hypothetical protein VFP68_18135 [Burkholderiaceae bacterium]|nr:hypothetical protein [Burkholderiaceae bacterium]